MPSAAVDAFAIRPAAVAPPLSLLTGGAGRLVLAGYPRSTQQPSLRETTAVQRPKEVLLALAAALAEVEGLPVRRANPHFAPVADWNTDLAVAHFCPVDLACPLPRAHNTLVLDGEDLLALAEERRTEDLAGLHRRRVLLMDRALLATPAAGIGDLLPEALLAPAPVEALLGAALPLPGAPGTAGGGAGQPGPVQWLACDLETGHYNFLELKRQPKLGTSHARVLLDTALQGGRPALLAFATPGTLGELGPVLRAFAALQPAATPVAGSPLAFVFFFGTYEEFAASLAARPQAMFFGDNFRCPAIRILFAPFAASDVLGAIRGAGVTVDCCYGGVLDALAAGLGVAHRVVLGPDGRFDARGPQGAIVQGIAWESLLHPGTLARRRQKADRSGERALAEVLEAMLRH